jgi:hypothetical protein
MAPNALFDRGRAREIQKAIAEGKPLPGCKGKQPLAEPVFPAVKEPQIGKSLRKTPTSGVVATYRPDMDMSAYRATQNLFTAIKEGNILKASVAIERGADIHSTGIYYPEFKPDQTMMGTEDITPLAYARMENQPGMVWLLQSKGAKE